MEIVITVITIYHKSMTATGRLSAEEYRAISTQFAIDNIYPIVVTMIITIDRFCIRVISEVVY